MAKKAPKSKMEQLKEILFPKKKKGSKVQPPKPCGFGTNE